MKLNAKKMALITLSMLGVSMFDNLKGVFLPSFVNHFDVSYSVIGWLFLSTSLSYMIGTFVGGFAMNRLSKATTMQLAAIMATMGMVLIVVFDQLAAMVIGFNAVGFATALSAMVINTTIPFLDVPNKAWFMNFVHFLYGIGATITVRIAGHLLGLQWGYRSIYGFVLAIFVAMTLVSLRVNLPEVIEKGEKKRPFTKDQTLLMFFFSIALGCYVVAEIQTAAWFVNYTVTSFTLTENDASGYMSTFFLLFSLGRLAGGVVAERFGYLRTVSCCLVVSLVLYSYGLLAGQRGLASIVAAGLFFSICFPTMVLSLKLYFGDNLNRASGIVVTAAIALNVISSFAMGYLSDQLGVAMAMYLIPASLLLSVVFTLYIQLRLTSNQQQVTL